MQPGLFSYTNTYGAPCSKEAIDPGRVDGRIRFPRVTLNDRLVKPVRRLTVRMIFMGPHVPRRRFSFARRECGVRFSKVPLFGGACSKVGEEALQATWKDSISFASTICTISLTGRALGYEPKDWVSTT